MVKAAWPHLARPRSFEEGGAAAQGGGGGGTGPGRENPPANPNPGGVKGGGPGPGPPRRRPRRGVHGRGQDSEPRQASGPGNAPHARAQAARSTGRDQPVGTVRTSQSGATRG